MTDNLIHYKTRLESPQKGWVNEAKRSETRTLRIAKTVKKLMEQAEKNKGL